PSCLECADEGLEHDEDPGLGSSVFLARRSPCGAGADERPGCPARRWLAVRMKADSPDRVSSGEALVARYCGWVGIGRVTDTRSRRSEGTDGGSPASTAAWTSWRAVPSSSPSRSVQQCSSTLRAASASPVR